MPKSVNSDWINLQREPETSIESVHAHFYGHAYDPHDHDEMLVGVTQTGLQRFNCHRTLHTSRPGRVILIEPGAVHDGYAPVSEGIWSVTPCLSGAARYRPHAVNAGIQSGRGGSSGRLCRSTPLWPLVPARLPHHSSPVSASVHKRSICAGTTPILYRKAIA